MSYLRSRSVGVSNESRVSKGSLPAWHLHAHIESYGNLRGVGEDKFRFWEERFAAEFIGEEVPCD